MKIESAISKKILASIFGDINKFCGKEDVIHAIIYHHLLESGLSSNQVAREQPVSKNPIDMVVFNRQIQGQFNKTDILPKIAIEVKGGAYGTRNALKDTIKPDGYCEDMEKLEKEINKGIEAWFICVDMPELGRSINDLLIKEIHSQCKKRNISFAYFCQGEEYFFHAPHNTIHSNEMINKNNDSGCDLPARSILSQDNIYFNEMCEQLLRINGHEANTTAALYRLFRKSGISIPQLSLETYFSFAKKPGSRMQLRPDMVLFDKEFDGMFSLYKKGNRNLSNDSHKMAYINTIIEVKGSASMNSKGDKERLKIYLEDIDKLKKWQTMAHNNGCNSLKGYFICLDGHKKPLPMSAIQKMFDISGQNPVVYISNSGIEISS